MFEKDKGQHILKNPLIINAMIEKASGANTGGDPLPQTIGYYPIISPAVSIACNWRCVGSGAGHGEHDGETDRPMQES